MEATAENRGRARTVSGRTGTLACPLNSRACGAGQAGVPVLQSNLAIRSGRGWSRLPGRILIRQIWVKPKMTRLILVAVVALLLAGGLHAQQTPDWTQPFPPYRIIDNIYYVGSQGLASFLIVTPQGNILINSSLEASVPLIRESIEKLGFKFSDTKILLISHAHSDGSAGGAGHRVDRGEIHGDGCRCARN